MGIPWDNASGYAVGIEKAREALELEVPFRIDDYGGIHTPLLLERLQQLGLAKGTKAVVVEEWASALLVADANSGRLVAVVRLEE